ncbi:2OG-Fe(II) oxygenase family protein [Planctobacterium marinum]|uniref:2OG-Fe(II) oxygenase family protein n=1 Tax=Planctobacterium marinum TaxID=1631968 RepID=UPI001E431430|nr:tetratricopeptide repeat protein [Planctobacterium marinum]MCC2605522.1 tetratricopeptide repeat protein [Planctobacterium marinum]
MSADLFKKALQAHQSGDLRSASEYYQKVLQRVPREHNALQLLGGVFHAQGDNATALKYLQASLNIKPDQPQVMLNVATCQRQLQDYSGALTTLKQLMRRDSANFGAFKCRMFVLVEMGDYERAYQELNAQIHKFPGHYELYNLLGAVASECEHFEKAIRAYQKALKIRPNSDVARHNLGLAYRQNGEPEKALKEYQIVLNSGKHSYQLMHNLGDTYFDLGHFEQAATYYRNALKLNFSSLESHIGLSETLWQSGEDKLFLSSFEKAVLKFPDKTRLLYSFIRRLWRVGQYKQAFNLLQSREGASGTDPIFQFLLAKCWLATGDTGQANTCFKKSLLGRELPLSDKLEVCRIYLDQARFSEAMTICTDILKTAPNHTEALAWWAVCLGQSKDKQVDKLYDFEHLIGSYQLFDKNTDGNLYRDLVDELSRKHRANEPVRDKSLHNGTQTRGHLFRKSQVSCLNELEKRMLDRVASYLEGRPETAKLRQWPDKAHFELTSACSVKLNSNGYQTTKIHAESQLTGVFYLTTYKAPSSGTEEGGYLKIGEAPLQNPESSSVMKLLKAEVGRLYIFPSYFWHATSPLGDAGQQITVSFEINSPKFS